MFKILNSLILENLLVIIHEKQDKNPSVLTSTTQKGLQEPKIIPEISPINIH